MLQTQKRVITVLLLIIAASAYFTSSQLFILSAWRASFDRPLSAEMPAPLAPAQENFGFSKSTSSTPSTANWKTYRNEKYGFELKFPSSWPIASSTTDSPWRFQSVSAENNFHGPGIPPEGNMWVDIAQGICNDPTTDFVYQGPKPDISEKTVCQNNFQITLWLWQTDPDLVAHKAILNQILSTFRFAPPPIDKTGLKTYRSEKYGFEVKYPAEFPFYEASRDFPPSVFTLLGSKDNVNVSAFLQVVPQDQINLYPFSFTFESPIADLAALASALRAKNNTEMKSVGLKIAVTVSDIHGSGGLKGVKSYVESASRPDGTKIIGIGYYFYRTPYFYRLVSIVPEVDAQLSSVASTFKFIPIVNATSSIP